MPVIPYKHSEHSKGAAVLFVKADWCGHCVATKPHIAHVASCLGNVLPVYAVDSEKNKKFIEKLDIGGFPTIFFRTPSGELVQYSGPREGKRIADWACAQSGGCSRPTSGCNWE